ncbi:MAG: ABC transporter ATP-binding protein [Spirochaetales bacterium]|nr:ABC transporter ATP-binding protein [Spirochaetales bacterium]
MDVNINPVIELENIHRDYRMGDNIVKALDGLSLTIGGGELTSIVGPSGSGKSTLMNIIGCLDRPTDGRVRLNGEDISILSDKRLSTIRNRNIGFIFQQFNLMPRLSILENVATPLLYSRVKTSERNRLATAALQKVGLGDRLKHRPTELSGGQKQRAAIARAIVTNPSLLLADEPTGALDTTTGELIMDLFRQLNSEGRTIIIVTHDPEVSQQCRRVVRVRDGKLEPEIVNVY